MTISVEADTMYFLSYQFFFSKNLLFRVLGLCRLTAKPVYEQIYFALSCEILSKYTVIQWGFVVTYRVT